MQATIRNPRFETRDGTDADKARRIELILRQIESLPTLPSVATRLLTLTASDDTETSEVVNVIRSDQSLTVKILRLCRSAEMGIREETLTVERAVILLGFTAIRNAVLSVKVFEAFAGGAKSQAEGEGSVGGGAVFDRPAFWRHCLATAVACELIARVHPECRDLDADELFVAGLLHDIGKLALDHVLPKSFARVLELTDLNQGNIAEFERRIIGIDHHTAGKRLAEQWQLPHRLQDCIWLHGSPYATLPRLDHRRMVGVVRLGDLLARKQHVGYSGNHVLRHSPAEEAAALGLDPQRVQGVAARLHDEIVRRSEALGLDEQPSRALYLASIQQANQTLGRLNDALDRRSRLASRQAQVLEGVTAFYGALTPGRSVQDVLDAVAASAAAVLGQGFYALLHQPGSDHDAGAAWLVCGYGRDGRPLRKQWIDPPPHTPRIARMGDADVAAVDLMGVLPWVADELASAPDLRTIRLLPLSSAWGTVAVLLHDQATLPPTALLNALTSTWGAAIGAANQHDGARRLGEDLAEANRALAETQDRLLEHESMARLGEMAAGAAHEMNNPLAVICGRSQLLAMGLPEGSKEQGAAQVITEQANKLSDLITALRMFAEPPQARRRLTDVGVLLQDVMARIRRDMPKATRDLQFSCKVQSDLPPQMLDPEHLALAMTELLENAVQAQPKTAVQVSARIEAQEHRLVINVHDDGQGMDAHTLAHAFDPFFSSKPAGRRMGVGLPRAKQWIAGHGGAIELRSIPGQSTTAVITIPLSAAA